MKDLELISEQADNLGLSCQQTGPFSNSWTPNIQETIIQ